jgi:hypothetical protein
MVGPTSGGLGDNDEDGKQDVLDGLRRSLEDKYVGIGSKPECCLEESPYARPFADRMGVGEPLGQELTPLPGRRDLTPESSSVLLGIRDV